MTRIAVLTGLLAFNGGFIDTVGLLGLHGLFLAHVTGNMVTLAAALVLDGHGVIAKALALPEFAAAIIAIRLAASLMAGSGAAPRLLFAAQTTLLFCFFLLAILLEPFDGSDTAGMLLTAGCGVAAMAAQNALQATYLPELPPTTFMSGNMLRAALDATDLASGGTETPTASRARLGRGVLGIVSFAKGCAVAALLFYLLDFWCLLLPVATGAAAAVIATGQVKIPILPGFRPLADGREQQ